MKDLELHCKLSPDEWEVFKWAHRAAAAENESQIGVKHLIRGIIRSLISTQEALKTASSHSEKRGRPASPSPLSDPVLKPIRKLDLYFTEEAVRTANHAMNLNGTEADISVVAQKVISVFSHLLNKDELLLPLDMQLTALLGRI